MIPAWLSNLAGIGSFIMGMWQAVRGRIWATLLFGGVGLVLLIVMSFRQLPRLRLWLVAKLQTAEAVARYEKTVNALELRGKSLGAAADLSRWTADFIAMPQAGPVSQRFKQMNEGLIDVLRDLFPQVERIALFVPENNILRIAFSARFAPDRVESLRLPVNDSAAGYAYLSGKRYFSANLSEAKDALYHALPESRDIRTLLCIPVKNGGKIFGVLSMDSRSPNALDMDIIELIETLCGIIAISWVVRDKMLGEGGMTS